MLATEINAKLAKYDCSVSLLAEALNVKASSVSQIINRQSDSKRIANAIAKVIQLPVEDIFPDKPQYHKGYSRKAVRDQKVNTLR